MTTVIYEFLPRFTEAIRVGLELRKPPPRAKRQTVRAIGERANHAKPGDILALYVRRHSFIRLIGLAICVDSLPITIHLDNFDAMFGCIAIEARDPFAAPTQLDEFAREEGFEHWVQMAGYFRTRYELYQQSEPFRGLLVRWRKLHDDDGANAETVKSEAGGVHA
jgi:hypothetical protein